MRQTDSLPARLLIPPCPVPTGLALRLATLEDLPKLHDALYTRQSYTQFQAYFRRLLRRQHEQICFWLVAEVRSDLVGNGQLLIYPHGAELANLHVAAAHQNQGIGTAMIHVLMAIALHVGLDNLEIGVALNNQRARALYLSLGFVADRQLRLTKQEPAIILRRNL